MIIEPFRYILKVTKIKHSSHDQCKYVVKSAVKEATMNLLCTLIM